MDVRRRSAADYPLIASTMPIECQPGQADFLQDARLHAWPTAICRMARYGMGCALILATNRAITMRRRAWVHLPQITSHGCQDDLQPGGSCAGGGQK